MKGKNKIKKTIPYWLIILAIFYLIPLCISDSGSAMATMLVYIPATIFTCSLVYGIKVGIDFVYPITVGLIFVPSIYIYYNSTASIYIVIYAIIALVGNLIGMLTTNLKK